MNQSESTETDNMKDQNPDSISGSAKKIPRKKNRAFPIILIILIVGGGWFGISKFIQMQHHATTDDAQISADILPVIPRVSGYVQKVYVGDNQFVHKGDTLFVIDIRDLKIKVDEAQAALATAKANVDASRANFQAAHSGIAISKAGVSTIDAQIEAAQIKLTRAQQDYVRYANLIQDHSITEQQFEEMQAARDLAKQQLAILQQQKLQAGSQTKSVTSQSSATQQTIEVAEAMVKQREVDLENAKLNLSYAYVTAPDSGHVSTVNIRPGQLVQAGQQVFNLVRSHNVWVVANFKETKYGRILPGQEVIVHVDAFPKHDFKAEVSSFSPATGARFSLLPPDNATGNFVKVVQRIPVKIIFDDQSDSLLARLRPGMNVTVDVHIK